MSAAVTYTLPQPLLSVFPPTHCTLKHPLIIHDVPQHRGGRGGSLLYYPEKPRIYRKWLGVWYVYIYIYTIYILRNVRTSISVCHPRYSCRHPRSRPYNIIYHRHVLSRGAIIRGGGGLRFNLFIETIIARWWLVMNARGLRKRNRECINECVCMCVCV